MLGRLAVVWATIGVALFLGSAIVRLAAISSQIDISEIGVIQWLFLIGWVAFMAYFEGYKGFQKSFSPRVAARIYFLRNNVTLARLVLAPVFCLGFFDSERKKMIFVWVLTAAIFVLIQLMSYVPMPWRGIIDVGVVVGLSWGLMSILIHTYQVFKKNTPYYDPCMPE